MFQKILVAMDMSKISHRAFEQAFALAEVSGASLILLHVLSPEEEGSPDIAALHSYVSSGGDDTDAKHYQELWEAFSQKGLEMLRSRVETAKKAGVCADCIQEVGSPGKVICEFAKKWDADLIVMGRRGISGLSELLLGSVSNYVIHHTCCSVLTVQ